MDYVSHAWTTHTFAVPGMDITHFCPRQDGMFKLIQQKNVKFSKKKLAEIIEVDCENIGDRNGDYDRSNSGNPIVNFDFSMQEFSDACALAKARIINLSEEALEYRRATYRMSCPDDTILFWKDAYCYIMDLLPSVASAISNLELSEIPRVKREKMIHQLAHNPFVHLHFGDVPDWLDIMDAEGIPLTIVSSSKAQARLDSDNESLCYLAENMLVTIESDQRICTNCITLVERIEIAPLQTVLVDAWVSVPEERLMLTGEESCPLLRHKVKVYLHNNENEPCLLHAKERVAQMFIGIGITKNVSSWMNLPANQMAFETEDHASLPLQFLTTGSIVMTSNEALPAAAASNRPKRARYEVFKVTERYMLDTGCGKDLIKYSKVQNLITVTHDSRLSIKYSRVRCLGHDSWLCGEYSKVRSLSL